MANKHLSVASEMNDDEAEKRQRRDAWAARQRPNSRAAARHGKRMALGEALEAANRLGLEKGLLNRNILDDTAAIWGEVLDRITQLFRYVQGEVNALEQDEFWVRKVDAQGNVLVEPNRWVQLERDLQDQLVEILGKVDGLDIEERRVTIEEAKAALVARFMDAVLDKLELTKEQQGLIGAAVEDALPIIEGTATVMEASRG